MTDTDRENIAETDAPSQRETDQSVYRVRQRITKELPQDIAIMVEHRPDLFGELWDIVCAHGVSGRSDEEQVDLFKRLSRAVEAPITVGEVVYEDGEQRPLSDAEETEEVATDE